MSVSRRDKGLSSLTAIQVCFSIEQKGAPVLRRRFALRTFSLITMERWAVASHTCSIALSRLVGEMVVSVREAADDIV